MIDQKKHKRQALRTQLIKESENAADLRIERYMEIDHQGVIGAHHFAAASSECIYLYRDGFYISAVMVSQAVNEGIIKFIAQSNGLTEKLKHDILMKKFLKSKILSKKSVRASNKIWKSFRNDVHHMNPKVSDIPFQELAKSNLQHLATIEKEVFSVGFNDGKLVPHQPKYWDVREDGTVPVYLRLE